jgi:hypothetical protein
MPSQCLLVAMLSAAAITAEFVGGKATRDALFLTFLGPAHLPAMLIATGLFSIGLVALYARTAGRLRSATVVPLSFVLSGLLFVLEWLLRDVAPTATSIAVYLHVSGAGPLPASGFWLIASQRFDPRTARARFGQIAGAGTIGGLLGALLSERVAARLGAPPMLLFLGALQFLAAWLVWLLARGMRETMQGEQTEPRLASGARVVAGTRHLRHLTALVLLGTTSAALAEYLFKARAVETFGSGDALLRFFALYYAATSVVSFGLQVVGSGPVLRHFGLALTTSSPSIALLAGAVGSLAAPGFPSLVVARAGESIFRASWFRAGYESFFTPMDERERRVAKPVIDVAVDRLGDALGGGIVRLIVVFAPLAPSPVILTVAILCSLGAIAAASQLNDWYLRTLEQSLVDQGGVEQAGDWTWPGATATGLVTARWLPAGLGRPHATHRSLASATTSTGAALLAPEGLAQAAAQAEVQDVLALRLGSRERIVDILERPQALSSGLVPHVIPLLAWDPVADAAMGALRRVVDDRVGMLLDALLDTRQPAPVRRRLARVLGASRSQRAVDGLLEALEDERFEVRLQAARSLAAIATHAPDVRVDPAAVERLVLKEVAVSRPIWEGRRLLADMASDSPFDAFVKDRAGQSLAHVFTILSLMLPREPLQIAFRGLTSRDERLRGTALEYLEGVLPAAIREGLWPFLEPSSTPVPARSHAAIVSDLLRDHPSPTLLDLARRHG